MLRNRVCWAAFAAATLLAAALIIALVLPASSATPVVSKDSDTSALVYLLDHGYLQKDENAGTAQLLSSEGLKKAIRDFQVCFFQFKLIQRQRQNFFLYFLKGLLG